MRAGRWVFGFLLLTLFAVAASCAKATPVLSCDSGKEACGGVCVSTADDSENCGACGNECPVGQACVAGKCATTCPNDDTICATDGGVAKCVSTKNDNLNCGACGKVCPAGEICFAGGCSGTCGDAKEGQTMCGGDGGSPYCANLQADQKNCGACGNACPSGQFCIAGQCRGACTASQTECGADAGQPYCADLMNDNANCGACGNPCPPSLHACIGGQCTNLCTGSQITCSGDAGSYCVDALTDNLNCGACGNACPTSKPFCAGGKCTTTGNGGTVRFTNGTIANVTYVPCGNGTNTNCTETVAETSCTSLGMKLVSHASDGTSAVVSLGATTSCYWSISYFTNNDASVAGQCLIGVSNAQWSNCCGLGSWHGNIVTVPATLGQQFGYVSVNDSGYNSMLSNVSGTTWGCQPNSSAPPAGTGCTKYFVACM